MKRRYKEGMYCSRKFAEWMLARNRKDPDYPASSYYKLVSLFCRTNYNELFTEEERKANEFTYDLALSGGCVVFKPSYELVYLPYARRIPENRRDMGTGARWPVPVDRFVPCYTILQTKGHMPGATEEAFRYQDFYTMKYIVEELVGRAGHIEKFASGRNISIEKILEGEKGKILGSNRLADEVKWEDVYCRGEFQEAECVGFIDNEWPYSIGPSCPDRLMCLQMYTRIIRHLMRETDRLGLVPAKGRNAYELRVAAYVAALVTLTRDPDFRLSEGIKREAVYEKSEEYYRDYCKRPGDLIGTCRKIRIGLLWDLDVFIDRDTYVYLDY